jgi:hypothetical protein
MERNSLKFIVLVKNYWFTRSCKGTVEKEYVPSAQFSPIVTSHVNIIQYQNQKNGHW